MIDFIITAMSLAFMVWVGRWLWFVVFSVFGYTVSFVWSILKKLSPAKEDVVEEEEETDVNDEGN